MLTQAKTTGIKKDRYQIFKEIIVRTISVQPPTFGPCFKAWSLAKLDNWSQTSRTECVLTNMLQTSSIFHSVKPIMCHEGLISYSYV